jgi:hypothetical protein
MASKQAITLNIWTFFLILQKVGCSTQILTFSDNDFLL